MTNEQLQNEILDTDNSEDGIGVVNFDNQRIWRNEPVGTVSFQTVCYCRKCMERWESCNCQDED